MFIFFQNMCCILLITTLETFSRTRGMQYLHPIAWTDICLPTHLGDLGIKPYIGLNQAALTRQLWNIVLNRPTCWSLWIKEKYLKRSLIWDVKVSSHVLVGWRQVLSLREKFLPYIWYLVGIGLSARFWHDHWLPEGRLKDIYGDRAIFYLGMELNILVSHFIAHGRWDLPQLTSGNLITIWQKASEAQIAMDYWRIFRTH